MNTNIPKLVTCLMKKYGTKDPEKLAKCLGVTIIRKPLEDVVAGFYKMINRRKYIFLNDDIEDEFFLRIVLAHELGHAIMHPKENCAFMRKHTLFLTSRLEIQANTFAAYLLIDDSLIQNFTEFTREQFCNCTGFPEALIKLRLE